MDYLSVEICKKLQKIGCCPRPIRWWVHFPDGEGWKVVNLPTSDAIPIPHPSDVLGELVRLNPDWIIDETRSQDDTVISIQAYSREPTELVKVSAPTWFEAMRDVIQAVLELSGITMSKPSRLFIAATPVEK